MTPHATRPRSRWPCRARRPQTHPGAQRDAPSLRLPLTQHDPQPLARPRQPRHDRPRRNPGHLGNRPIGQCAQLPQDDHLAKNGRQRIDRRQHDVRRRRAIVARRIDRLAHVDGVIVLDEHRAAPLLAEPLHAPAAHDRQKPVPAIIAAQAVDMTQRPKTRLLHHVARGLAVSRQVPGQRIPVVQIGQDGGVEPRAGHAGNISPRPSVIYLTTYRSTALSIDDGIDRRGFLKCMAWTGTGLAWAMVGGIPRSVTLGEAAAHDLFFVQLSDSHMGFDKPANSNVAATFQAAIDNINALPVQPSFLLHTGDISHLSQPAQFDQVDQMIRGARTKSGREFYVPGEHDVLNDNGQQYRQRYGKDTKGNGWYSFDDRGVHFIGLVNVLNLKAGGLGNLGADQLAGVKLDVASLSSSTPIVVFAHVPLWAVYPTWGWGTDDGTQALALLSRFGSVTVLNGHIHQVVQKVEGHMTFHTALSTAFPQPSPGTAQAPGPVTVDAPELRHYLGLSTVTYLERPGSLAVVDSALEGGILTAGIGAAANTTAR